MFQLKAPGPMSSSPSQLIYIKSSWPSSGIGQTMHYYCAIYLTLSIPCARARSPDSPCPIIRELKMFSFTLIPAVFIICSTFPAPSTSPTWERQHKIPNTYTIYCTWQCLEIRHWKVSLSGFTPALLMSASTWGFCK